MPYLLAIAFYNLCKYRKSIVRAVKKWVIFIYSTNPAPVGHRKVKISDCIGDDLYNSIITCMYTDTLTKIIVKFIEKIRLFLQIFQWFLLV